MLLSEYCQRYEQMVEIHSEKGISDSIGWLLHTLRIDTGRRNGFLLG